ncbi:3-hydroxyacyl-CoA dehydrogenase [Alicyclobacillus cycloheptanicus]|uniref:NAD(P)-dependent dehydrogenase (Short-subunit alcohol dehydrogenase family) n=1 Tax=Alicyclobacillus cycloheptanicus TaxID=1457 RepID=A0ABT9XKE7_9BACL|nr:3-hydroxyacyl-CoA dehydrogenase [Alicyclobacillus cycloheptanicus]MDQ0190216.1 NAD(P)-dependent dehydrogenase (short-subunit alcohol dehydrogenase family) [Alicyclobacillus cycloheptanicus]
MQIQGKTFLVTGGASGLGGATAEVLRQAGANVVIVDLNTGAGKKKAEEIDALFVQTDVTDEASVKNAVETAVNQYGGLNGAINCAGLGFASRVIGRHGLHPLDFFTKVLQVNVVGTFNVIRLAANAIKEAEPNEDGERGVIVNTASVAAFEGQIGQAAYAASKGAVVSMTLPIAREFAQFGIRVCSIAPGTFDTPMLGMLPEEARDSLGKQIPFPSRLGKPVEYGMLAKHIIENPMLNGEVIRLDGAIRMQPK